MIVYLITNLVNGKQYVGKTVQKLSTRWSAHLSDARNTSLQPIHCAIRKYGPEHFRCDDILSTLDTNEALCHWEAEMITLLHTRAPYGYNVTEGGEGMTGWVPSLESRKKMSEAGKRRKTHPQTPETRELISRANKGRKRPDMVQQNKNLQRSEKQKSIFPNYWKSLSPELIKKRNERLAKQSAEANRIRWAKDRQNA